MSINSCMYAYVPQERICIHLCGCAWVCVRVFLCVLRIFFPHQFMRCMSHLSRALSGALSLTRTLAFALSRSLVLGGLVYMCWTSVKAFTGSKIFDAFVKNGQVLCLRTSVTVWTYATLRYILYLQTTQTHNCGRIHACTHPWSQVHINTSALSRASRMPSGRGCQSFETK